MKNLLKIVASIALCFILFKKCIDPVTLLVFKMPSVTNYTESKTLEELIGYPKNTKLLVVNSDDTAAHPTFTDGVFKLLKYGIVKSTSVIVHDHNDQELQRIAKEIAKHPDWGIGIHLTLTNEYQDTYPWKPVLPKDIVPSLYNSKGLAWEKIEEVVKYANPKEVALEFDAQIRKAIANGIDPSHLDSHMGTMYRDSEYPGAEKDALRKVAIAMAKKHALPMTMNTFDENSKDNIAFMDTNKMIRPNVLFGFYELEEINSHMDYKGNSFKKWVTAQAVSFAFGFNLPYLNSYDSIQDFKTRLDINKKAIKSLVKPGLNHFYMHAAHEHHSDENIPDGKNHPPGVDKIVREGDLAVWTSPEMKAFLKKENILIINYNKLKKIQQITK